MSGMEIPPELEMSQRAACGRYKNMDKGVAVFTSGGDSQGLCEIFLYFFLVAL